MLKILNLVKEIKNETKNPQHSKNSRDIMYLRLQTTPETFSRVPKSATRPQTILRA